MLKYVVLGVVLVGLIGVGANAQVVVATSWDATTLSAPNFAALVQALRALENIVDDRTYGSRKTLNEDGWTGGSFARYAGGILSGMGYQVLVASGSARSSTETWLLVRLVAGGASAWVPVVTTPAAGQAQGSLGRVALATTSETRVSFDVQYTLPSQTEQLPANASPRARLRVSTLFPVLNSALTMYSVLSGDSDGEVVLYRWRVGSDPWFGTTEPSATVAITQAGYYPIVLQIIDDGGASATASVGITVEDAGPKPAPDPACGCTK
ncbi:MAG: PKD domain-containing protein [Candidatus Bipolaricaulis sp.]|nr:PKD domain-containing protein [Candidatus Bipolaricaulis sp.]